jgi:ParB family transcriptional regulator, chromosome partitioning protein
MLVIKKQVDASAADTVNGSSEYRTVPLTELFESPTNPRKNFDKESLGELTASIRSKGVLSSLVVRPVNGHFEIVAGARRFRAVERAGLAEVPVRVTRLTDAEAAEVQAIENLIRTEAQIKQPSATFQISWDNSR